MLEFMNRFSWWRKLTNYQEIPNYPIPFAIVTYNKFAIERGIRDEANKIILLHFFDNFGMLKRKLLPYSDERVFAMEKIKKIPVLDKTESTERFPIYKKLNASEVVYPTYG